MGEGAGILVFEELEHARRRGARVYAEVKGYGCTADAYHITAPAPEGEGAARAMKLALADAQLQGEDIDYINAHGTSTLYNDKFETQAIKTVFGDHAYRVAVSSTKSMLGHLLGAAGGVEIIATCLSLVEDVIHPTINYEYPDPECDLDYVPNRARPQIVRNAISNSLGFGGHTQHLSFPNIMVAKGDSMRELVELETRIGIKFTEPRYLEKALTHASFANECSEGQQSNERLEFLGDAVLELAVSELLYYRYPELPEGALTKRRAALVCEATLEQCARQLELGTFLRLGKGEELSGGRERPALLADALEALLGAIFLTRGWRRPGLLWPKLG